MSLRHFEGGREGVWRERSRERGGDQACVDHIEQTGVRGDRGILGPGVRLCWSCVCVCVCVCVGVCVCGCVEGWRDYHELQGLLKIHYIHVYNILHVHVYVTWFQK